MENIICEICSSEIKRRKDLQRHKRSEFCKKVSNILVDYKNKEKNLHLEIKNLKDKIFSLEKENIINKEKSEEYRKIIENTNSLNFLKIKNDNKLEFKSKLNINEIICKNYKDNNGENIKDVLITEELDKISMENKLLKTRIKSLESKILKKQQGQIYTENKNVVYIVTTENKELQGHYKIGKAQDLQRRISVYNTSDKHEVIYNTSCKNKKSMNLLEQLVHMKLENKRIEPNKEWYISEEEGEDLIKVIEECKKINNL